MGRLWRRTYSSSTQPAFSPAIGIGYRQEFEPTVLALAANTEGLRDALLGSGSEGVLAATILLDQFPRNIYRNTPRMFEFDKSALGIAKDALLKGVDKDQALLAKYGVAARGFLYLPFEHAEDLEEQSRSVSLCEGLLADFPEDPLTSGFLQYARAHEDLIKRFGRFPHRNSLLGRCSTAEEDEYLSGGGETFGVAGKK